MATRKALLIQPNGDLDVREITGLDDMYAAIGSDNLDWTAPGPLNYICYGYALYERAVNPVATALYTGVPEVRVTSDEQDGKWYTVKPTHPDATEPLCGPVLVFGPIKNEEETSISDTIIRLAVTIRDTIGRDEIARLAVPLTDMQKRQVEMRMMAANAQAREALKSGRGVDFGGIQLQPPVNVATDGTVTTDEVDDLFGSLFGDQIDGNRRQGRKP